MSGIDAPVLRQVTDPQTRLFRDAFALYETSSPRAEQKTRDEILAGLTLDGVRRTVTKNEVVVIPRGVKHAFASAAGAVIEEISSAYAQSDSYYTDPRIGENPNRKTYVTNWMD